MPPILAGDIKLLKSAVMDDVPEGGGAPTATVVVDGTSNSIFNDISELDRAGGRVNLRKLFASVRTPNTDGYFGANVIVAEPPQDPRVSVTLFSTGETFDRRSEAVGRIESYLNGAPEWAGYLYENHLNGQRSFQLFQRTNQAPPAVGRTLLLRQNEGLSTEFEQYVRVTRVTVEERTFTYNVNQDYQALVVTCDISDRLRYDFTGSPANRSFTRSNGSSIVRDTLVADAADYHGVVALTQPVAIGDAKCTAASVYTQLVPNSRTETALLDQKSAAGYLVPLASAPRAVTVGGSPLSQRIRIGQENRGFSYVTMLKPLPAPGSLRVVYRALGNTYTIQDNGDGSLGGGDAPGSGNVVYGTGSVSVTLAALPDDRSGVVFYWGENQSYTNRAGQAGFRPPEYAFDLEKQGIVADTFTISWTSGGVVKTATSNASGVLSGDGTGELQAITGLVLFRPSFMPDPNSEFDIDYEWREVIEEHKPGLTPDGAGVVAFSLTETPAAGTLEVQWVTERQSSLSSGASSGRGSSGKSSGSSTTTQIVNTTKTYRDYSPSVAAAYNAPREEYDVEQKVVGGEYTRPWVPYVPGSGQEFGHVGTPYFVPGYNWEVTQKSPVVVNTRSSASNSSSHSQSTTQTSRSGVAVSHRAIAGTDNNFYGTLGSVAPIAKTVSIKVTGDWTDNSFQSNYETASAWESLNETGTSGGGGPAPSAGQGGGGGATSKGGENGSESQKEVFGGNSLWVRYVTGLETPQTHSETFTPPATVLDLTPYSQDAIVPGSVRFVWMGTTYEDFEGVVYRGRTINNPGTACGAVSYSSGLCTMYDYIVSGSPSSFSLDSCWTTKARTKIANVTFNTQLAPIKPSALVLNVVDVDGNALTATADLDGDIEATHVRGKVDYETGLVEVQFGDYVLDSGLTAEQKAEWWYDAANIRAGDGMIWRPWPVDPETLRYNFVSYFYLPIDADILGMDPVRLPQDGRVPIFRPGGFAVLGNTQTVGPVTVTNGQTINCARDRLSRVRVLNDVGQVIDAGHTANLDAGTVTFTDVSGMAQPVTIEHRVEDMAMVADVQINGVVSFTRQITHAYPAGTSYLSSALVAGDVRARTSLVFDQVSWNGSWSDAVVGSAATGTFNDTYNPIAVTNLGAVTERWIVRFTSNLAFEVIGEHVGLIAVGNTSTDCAPANPAAGGEPFFTIPATGWGGGWATGNVLRFNTVGAMVPVWAVRTIQQGPETVPDDDFTLLIRGDVDRP